MKEAHVFVTEPAPITKRALYQDWARLNKTMLRARKTAEALSAAGDPSGAGKLEAVQEWAKSAMDQLDALALEKFDKPASELGGYK